MAPDPQASDRITFATWLRDTVPMPESAVRQLLALDDADAPSLSDARAALGSALDLSDCWAAFEAVAPDFTVPQPDARLAAALDALWLAVRGPRVVRTEIAGDGITASREAAPVALREGERLAFLLVARNATAEALEVSAEAHGEGTGRTAPAGRTCALLFDAGPMPAGSYLLPLLVVAGGVAATLDVPIECAATGRLDVRIIDDDTSEPVAARVYCTDALGPVALDGTVLRRDRHGNAWAHADGGFTAIAAGTARLRIVRGIEYEAAERAVTVPADGVARVAVRLRRWSHMAADGWRSGDVHAHLHYGGEMATTLEDAALAQRAEDLHLLQLMAANCNDGGHLLDGDVFSAEPHAVSDADHLLVGAEEYRNALYGHLCLTGIGALVDPAFTGVPMSPHPHDFPTNADIAARARALGGAISYAHPVLEAGTALDRIFSFTRNVEAKALPVDAALRRIDAVDVMSYPGQTLDVVTLWYRLLNCGLRLAATAGSDAFMNMNTAAELPAFDVNGDAFSSPPGGVRCFARIDGAFTPAAWRDAVLRGETFVTSGPMIDLQVDGHGPGAELRAARGARVRIEASAGATIPFDSLELVVDGDIVARTDATDGREATLAHELEVTRSCWIAARALGGPHELALSDIVFAHTGPVYVRVEGAPARSPGDAAYFVAWIDRLIALTAAEGVFADGAQRDAVLAQFREARAYYAAMGNHQLS
jgi:hypothetical protein